jgi:hypothetical protein
MSESVLKKQKLVADDLCACINLFDAARQHHIKCVAKYSTDLKQASVRSSVLRSIKHESKDSQRKGCTACVTALLAAGASVNPSGWALSPVAVAAGAGCVSCLNVLLAHGDGLTSEASWMSAVEEAALSSSVEPVQILLDAAPTDFARELLQVALLGVCDHRTLGASRHERMLHTACHCRAPLMAYVLARGACVNSPFKYCLHKPLESRECTPLGVLAQVGCCADIEMLVNAHKADINLKFGVCKCTAMHLACAVSASKQQGVAAVIQKLAELGADL